MRVDIEQQCKKKGKCSMPKLKHNACGCGSTKSCGMRLRGILVLQTGLVRLIGMQSLQF